MGCDTATIIVYYNIYYIIIYKFFFTEYHKVEVHITHPEAGIIMLVEDELKKIFYNKNF